MARGLGSFPTCRLGRLMDQGTLVGSPDALLLERFANQGDEAAFEGLVARHGPMVLWVCRSVLRDSHDAEDAFQATFLILARKANSVWVKETLANWLYRIAVRVAVAARTSASERKRHERQAFEVQAAGASTPSGVDPDVLPMLCEEITRLPRKYREPVVLCHLEELTHDAAARVLECPVGTVHGRLSRARGLLRERLARRGLATLTALAAARSLEGRSLAVPIPPALAQSTVQAAIHDVAGNAISSGLVPATSASLATRALRGGSMNLLKKSGLLGLLATLTIGTGLVASGGSKQKGPDPKPEPPRKQPAKAAPMPIPDSKAIQGTWVVTRVDQVGHQPSNEERALFNSGKVTMTIDATRIIFDTDKSRMSYTLDTARTPRRMMLETSSGRKAIGIYKLERDDLQLFHGRGTSEDDVPPADFSIKSARPGTSPTLFVLKRKNGVPVPAKDANEKDHVGRLSGDVAHLQGTWKLIGVEESRAEQKSGGLVARLDSLRAVFVPDGPADRIHWTVKDDQISLADDDERVTASFRLDETRNPKRIDITFTRLKATDDARRQDVIYGIYKIDGDSFTCCFGLPQPNPDLSRVQRPSEFETLSGTGLRVYILKREQPLPPPEPKPTRTGGTFRAENGTQVPSMMPVFGESEEDTCQLILPPVKGEPIFVDFDTARILWPPCDLEPRDSRYPLVLPNLAFTERLRQWVRSTGVDAVIQTDGIMVHMMGLDLQTGQTDASSILHGTRLSSPAIPGPLIRSLDISCLRYLTREGSQGSFFANVGKHKSSPLAFSIQQGPGLAGPVRKKPAWSAETLIVGEPTKSVTVGVENGILVVSGSDKVRRIEIGGGTVKVKNGSDTLLEASRIVSPFHDLDGRREQLVFPEGSKLSRIDAGGKVRLQFQVTRAGLDEVPPILMQGRPQQVVGVSVRPWGQLQEVTRIERAGDQVRVRAGNTIVEGPFVMWNMQ